MRIAAPSTHVITTPIDTPATSRSTERSVAPTPPQSSPRASQSTSDRTLPQVLATLNPVNQMMRHGPQIVTDVVVFVQAQLWNALEGLLKDPTPIHNLLQANGVESPAITAGVEYNAAWAGSDELARHYRS